MQCGWPHDDLVRWMWRYKVVERGLGEGAIKWRLIVILDRFALEVTIIDSGNWYYDDHDEQSWDKGN